MVIDHLQLMGSSSIFFAQMLLRHPQNAALRKTAIFGSAVRCFLQQNGDADSFDEIVQRILQPQRSLYWHQAQTMNTVDCKFVREKSTPPNISIHLGESQLISLEMGYVRHFSWYLIYPPPPPEV